MFYRPKLKRKRILKMASDSSDDSNEEIKNSQGSTPGKNGRKNIRKVLKDKQVAEDTKLAAKEEEEILKRIAERETMVCVYSYYQFLFIINTFIIYKYFLL